MNSLITIAASLCLLPLVTASLAMGYVFSNAVSATSKNPEEYGKIIGAAVMGTIFIESLALISAAVAFTLIFRM